jgi:undecaprenyl-diphosphatase
LHFLELLLLALVQALTEFLPISSSGHLVLARHLLGLPGSNLLLDVLLHVGTLGATVVYFQRELRVLFRGIVRSIPALRATGRLPRGARWAALLLLACLPTALIGLGLKRVVEHVAGAPALVLGLLVVNGLVLQVSRLGGRRGAPRAARRWRAGAITPGLALAVGAAQGLAVLPGFSRAGLTIVTGLLCGAKRADAARFAMLASVPAILGALSLEAVSQWGGGRAGSGPSLGFGEGMLAVAVAGAAGYGALALLVRFVRGGRLHRFAWYCWGLAAVGALAVWA